MTSHRWPPEPGGTWVLDLDGVVWLTGEIIEGADAAVARLRAAGTRVLFATNNSAPTVAELLERLRRIDIPAEASDLVTSAQAAATLVPRGSRVLVLAEEGVREALAGRGVTIVGEGPADVVVVGWTNHFDFDAMARAAGAARQGARLVGTNEDPTHPTPRGLMPGCGALLAAVATASGVAPTVAGKPYRPMAELIGRRAGDVVVAVGDRPSTDGELARQLGAAFGLVLSGVTPPGSPPPDPPADACADTLAALVDTLLPG